VLAIICLAERPYRSKHHDFFLAPHALLLSLASKYATWGHEVHSILELLYHRLPKSLEHMLSFVHLSCSTMVLLFKTVPTFEGTWIECLEDLEST